MVCGGGLPGHDRFSMFTIDDGLQCGVNLENFVVEPFIGFVECFLHLRILERDFPHLDVFLLKVTAAFCLGGRG